MEGEAADVQDELSSGMSEADAAKLAEGDVVAFSAGPNSVGLLVLDATHPDQALVTGRKLVPTEQGSWSQRRWTVEVRQGAAVRQQEAYKDLLCLVELESGRLTPASIEALRGVGVVLYILYLGRPRPCRNGAGSCILSIRGLG